MDKMTLCPVCRSSAKKIASYSGDHLAQLVSSDLGRPCPSDLVIPDYSEWRCDNCSIEFADPMTPGSDRFYEWRTNAGNYYAQGRWEFGIVLDILKQQFALQLRGLDIGCGSGCFLSKTNALPNVIMAGIDTTESAVTKCLDKGLIAFHELLCDFKRREEWQGLDFITSFHCLEHVSDPVALTREALSLLRPGGSLFLSTPYSPTCLEMHSMDPLNHPPHHLTRWNLRSVMKLASQVQCSPRVHLPKPERSRNRALYALAYHYKHRIGHAGTEFKSRTRLAWLHPVKFVQYWYVQRSREIICGRPAPSVVLLELRKDSDAA